MEELKLHIKENMIHVTEMLQMDDKLIVEKFKIKDCYYSLDTESCGENSTAWVYGWGIGNTENDIVVYGDNIDDIYMVFDKIARAHNKKFDSKKGSIERFNIFIHNLKWDFEFMKYSLMRMGFEIFYGEVKWDKFKVGQLPPGTFSIVEKDGNVYGATIKLHDTIKQQSSRKNKKGEYNTKEIAIELKLVDSYKIVQQSLKDIANEIIDVEDMFKKIDGYDYDTIRNVGHVLSEEEKMYLYNDVYLVKEFVKQFYVKLGTTKTTASSIAFESFLEITYKKGSLSENYKLFEEMFPDLTKYNKIYRIINKSYTGGLTQCNRKFKNKDLKLNNAVSIDRNSSYPAVIRDCMLPYGEPLWFEREVSKEECEERGYQMRLLRIAFDAFKNNAEDDLIGNIKVGALNVDDFGMKANEYAHTNIIGGEEIDGKIYDADVIGGNTDEGNRKYILHIWDFELENLLEHMSFYVEGIKKHSITGIQMGDGVLTKGYDVLDTILFKGKVGQFAEAVQYYADMKIRGKKENNAVMTAIAKMMMNSFYGKTGSTDIKYDRILSMNEEGIIKYDGVKQTYRSNKKYYKAFASAVTAWGRVDLRTNLYKIGYNNVMYFDTDSLYTTLTKEELESICEDILHDTELGKWKIERTYSRYKCIGAKQYILEDNKGQTVFKCAGLPKNVKEEVTFENFVQDAEFTIKQNKAVKGGYIMEDGIYRIFEE